MLWKTLTDQLQKFEGLGLVRSSLQASGHGSQWVHVDGDGYVGTITFWPERRFELQFNNSQTGAVLVLETTEFDRAEDLTNYVVALWAEKLAHVP